MLTLLFVFLALASAGPLERLKEKTNVVSSLKERVIENSLLQRCLDGSPILLATTHLPGNNRGLGDPCETTVQCRNPFKCLCQSHGGKECARDNCVVEGVEIPDDGEVHVVYCLSCQCHAGVSACLTTCPTAFTSFTSCAPGFREAVFPPAEGECCNTKRCVPDDIGDCEGAGVRCAGFAGLQCPNANMRCIDDPSDDCDPTKGGADCMGICKCPTPGCGVFAQCGGIAGLPCTTDLLPEMFKALGVDEMVNGSPWSAMCVDDPSDNCDPEKGGADCIGCCILYQQM